MFSSVGRWPAYRVVGLTSGVLTVLGFIGLGLCKLVEERQGMTEAQFMETLVGGVGIWSLSGCFLLGAVLSPISLYLQKRAGLPLPGPTVPGWVAWPFKFVIVLGFCLLVLIVIGVALATLFED